jgi:hypothetical protein
MVAQLVHAAGESSPGNLPNDTHAVVLAAKDEADLLSIEQQLISAGVPHRSIREPDSPFNGAITAIGIVPTAERKAIRSILSRHPLVR